MPITQREQAEVASANGSGRQPVVFVHGLWLLANSWDPWRELFEERGYTTLAPGWPDDPETTASAVAHPDVLAGKSIGGITTTSPRSWVRSTARRSSSGTPSAASSRRSSPGWDWPPGAVAIDPAPFRGVLPLPVSSLRSSFPVLKNPANRKRAVMLTFEQWTYGFTNAIPEDEGRRLYDTYAVPGSGLPLFEAATANINWRTEASVDTKNPDRGPLLIISGELDHTVPWKIANASYKRYRHSPAPTEITEIPGRGHSLVIDHGWHDVADTALAFLERHHLTA